MHSVFPYAEDGIIREKFFWDLKNITMSTNFAAAKKHILLF